jgi:hypothetical protein
MTEAEVEQYSCRFCLDEGQRIDFIAPCRCAGTSKWVHRECLDKWRSTREDKAFSQCTECKADYDIICITNDSSWDVCNRGTRFCCYFTRDFSLVIIVSQLMVFAAGAFVYLLDMYNHHLFKMSKMHSMMLFYYFMGWFLLLASIGTVALCFRNSLCQDCTPPDGALLYCADPTVPYLCCANDGIGGGGCCCRCCVGTNANADCCSLICCNNCGDCSLAALGQEMLVVLFVVMIILAIIGVFVAALLGIWMIQHIVRKHIHILNKWNLTKEYIVRDLAPDGLTSEELLYSMQRNVNHHKREEEEDTLSSSTTSIFHDLTRNIRYQSTITSSSTSSALIPSTLAFSSSPNLSIRRSSSPATGTTNTISTAAISTTRSYTTDVEMGMMNNNTSGSAISTPLNNNNNNSIHAETFMDRDSSASASLLQSTDENHHDHTGRLPQLTERQRAVLVRNRLL